MPEVVQFTNGPVNPAIAYVLAFLGSLLALNCTRRARATSRSGARARWLVFASITLGAAVWLMHFVAMLGFDIPASPVAYDLGLTEASAGIAVVVVAIGTFLVGFGRRSTAKLLLAGVFTGAGIAAMHYTGMAAMRLAGTISYDRATVSASVLIAIVAATVAFWFSLTINSRLATFVAALIMGVAVVAMHYTGMAAMHVHLSPEVHPVQGISPILLVLPITVVAALALLGLVISSQAMGGGDDFRLTLDAGRHAAPGDDGTAEAPSQGRQPHPVSLAAFSGTAPRRTNPPRGTRKDPER
jgi:NO-binding membrane sensor protein with MHYT domain